ncbi:MAG: hypothetical protein RSD57_13110 [Comamonas sp.]
MTGIVRLAAPLSEENFRKSGACSERGHAHGSHVANAFSHTAGNRCLASNLFTSTGTGRLLTQRDLPGLGSLKTRTEHSLTPVTCVQKKE